MFFLPFILIFFNSSAAKWLSKKDDVDVFVWVNDSFTLQKVLQDGNHGHEPQSTGLGYFLPTSNTLKLRLDFRLPIKLNKLRIHAASQDNRPDFGYTQSNTKSSMSVVYDGQKGSSDWQNFNVKFGSMHIDYGQECAGLMPVNSDCSEWTKNGKSLCEGFGDEATGLRCRWVDDSNSCDMDVRCGSLWADIEQFPADQYISSVTLTLFSASDGVSVDEINVDGEWKPTEMPTPNPTFAPTNEPTDIPTVKPTAFPSTIPTKAPTDAPSFPPTEAPTTMPTPKPTYEHCLDARTKDTCLDMRFCIWNADDKICEDNEESMSSFLRDHYDQLRVGSPVHWVIVGVLLVVCCLFFAVCLCNKNRRRKRRPVKKLTTNLGVNLTESSHSHTTGVGGVYTRDTSSIYSTRSIVHPRASSVTSADGRGRVRLSSITSPSESASVLRYSNPDTVLRDSMQRSGSVRSLSASPGKRRRRRPTWETAAVLPNGDVPANVTAVRTSEETYKSYVKEGNPWADAADRIAKNPV